MEQDLFKNLPLEITFNIFLRLPLKAIGRCKCVSKPWLDLLETPDFANSRLSKSPGGVIVSQQTDSPKRYRYIESMKDRSEAFNFSFPRPNRVFGSANGLLFLFENTSKHQNCLIVNPVTRSYISVPCPRRNEPETTSQWSTFGFGVSKRTVEYKLVHYFGFSKHRRECEVYTLGTGEWRRITPFEFSPDRWQPGLFVKGNLYWLNGMTHKSLCCFDLETESFSDSSPPCDGGHLDHLSIMEECLCYCYNSDNDDIVVWSMSEVDGGVGSWTKKFVISKPITQSRFHDTPIFRPIAVFDEGDILMGVHNYSKLVKYSNESKIVEGTDLVTVDIGGLVDAVYYKPSFVSLKPFSKGRALESF